MAGHRAGSLCGAVLVVFLAPGAALAGPSAAERVQGAERDHECLVCHAGIGPEEAPKLMHELYRASMHGQIGCISCHADVDGGAIDHEREDQDLARVRCAACHEAQQRLHARSVHAEVRRGATCAQCHGGHDVFPARDRRSSTSPFKLSAMCRECHDKERHAAGHTLDVPRELLGQRLPIDGDATARMIAKGVSLTLCTDCHGVHDLQRAGRPGAATSARMLPATCGACHEKAAAELARSVHARVGADGAPGATCISCHPLHDRPGRAPVELGETAVRECGRCHESLMRSYAASYHGKATLSGDATAARCSDCHGSHEVLGLTDPRSQIAPGNKLATCRKCHRDAPPRFASFMPHVDPDDRAQAPLLYWARMGLKGLVALLAAFFLLHSLAWAVRNHRDRAEAPAGPTAPMVRRYRPLTCLLHAGAIVSFLGLGVTGAVMSFDDQSWARAILLVAGGMRGVALLHAILAVAALAAFAVHLAIAARSAWRRRRQGHPLLGPDSIVPRLADLRELAAHVRWFTGRGARPVWNRWGYWEKLQYWSVAGILLLSGLTGLMLWLPSDASRSLPGAMLNLAAVLHSEEALLASAIIIAAHVAHAFLRRGSAPVNPSMFTGLVAEADYRRERAPEWARIDAEERADELRCPAPGVWRRRLLLGFGMIASLGCVALLALALYGLLLA